MTAAATAPFSLRSIAVPAFGPALLFSIGEGAIVGAGSGVTKDVASDELAIARGEQRGFKGWAARFRERQQAKKNRTTA